MQPTNEIAGRSSQYGGELHGETMKLDAVAGFYRAVRNICENCEMIAEGLELSEANPNIAIKLREMAGLLNADEPLNELDSMMVKVRRGIVPTVAEYQPVLDRLLNAQASFGQAANIARDLRGELGIGAWRDMAATKSAEDAVGAQLEALITAANKLRTAIRPFQGQETRSP